LQHNQQPPAPAYQPSGLYPATQFSTYQPPDLASNPFLRVPGQPQYTVPPAIATRAVLLTEISQLQVLFARNQHAVNQQILDRLTAPAHAVAAQGPRPLPCIKASDVGMFNPTSVPEAAAAILFIDKIHDAVKQYGEDRTLLVLKRCCNNDIASSWLTGLDAQDWDALITSAEAWERLLRRDFMPNVADLEAKAKEEVFKWSQSRTPSQYVSDKIKLLRISRITNPDAVEKSRTIRTWRNSNMSSTVAPPAPGTPPAIASVQLRPYPRPPLLTLNARFLHLGRLIRRIDLARVNVVISLRAEMENTGIGNAR
jgi:hypothetical protein